MDLPLNPTQEQMQALVDDFHQWFVVEGHPRAITLDGSCQYRTVDGRGCAIGRHIPDEKYDPRLEGHGAIRVVAYLNDYLDIDGVHNRDDVPCDVSELYSHLQICHDIFLSSEHRSQLPKRMQDLCTVFNLKNPMEAEVDA